jgi:propanol-preferring alcohol dehydrogenase
MAAARPETMFAWRKHKGNPKPVCTLDIAQLAFDAMELTLPQVWEEVPVPKPSPTGVLVKMLASGGMYYPR